MPHYRLLQHSRWVFCYYSSRPRLTQQGTALALPSRMELIMVSLARVTLMALGLILVTATLGSAEEGGGGGGGISLPVLIFTSWTMWPLIILSVVGVSMAIQRMITITPDVMVPPGLGRRHAQHLC